MKVSNRIIPPSEFRVWGVCVCVAVLGLQNIAGFGFNVEIKLYCCFTKKYKKNKYKKEKQKKL